MRPQEAAAGRRRRAGSDRIERVDAARALREGRVVARRARPGALQSVTNNFLRFSRRVLQGSCTSIRYFCFLTRDVPDFVHPASSTSSSGAHPTASRLSAAYCL